MNRRCSYEAGCKNDCLDGEEFCLHHDKQDRMRVWREETRALRAWAPLCEHEGCDKLACVEFGSPGGLCEEHEILPPRVLYQVMALNEALRCAKEYGADPAELPLVFEVFCAQVDKFINAMSEEERNRAQRPGGHILGEQQGRG